MNTQKLGFLRLPQVLEIIPVSKSAWWLGVQQGRFPPALKLSARTTVWKKDDVQELCGLLAQGKDWRDHSEPKAAA